jgi:hypothetical protein
VEGRTRAGRTAAPTTARRMACLMPGLPLRQAASAAVSPFCSPQQRDSQNTNPKQICHLHVLGLNYWCSTVCQYIGVSKFA